MQSLGKLNAPSSTGPNEEGKPRVAIRFCGETSPIVAGKVKGKDVRLLIDTGSKVSLLKESVFRELSEDGDAFEEHRSAMCTRLAGITGQELETRGCFRIPFEIGSTVATHPCFICTDDAMIPVSGILGQDMVRTYAIDVLSSRGMVVINGEEIPILNWSPDHVVRGLDYTEVPIMLVSECVIPPRTEVIVAGRVRGNLPVGSEGVVEMTELEPHGLLGVDLLAQTNARGQVPVRIVNVSMAEIRLPKHKRVATFVGVEADQNLEGVVLSCGPAGEVSETEFLNLFHLTHLPDSDRERVSQLLCKYRTAFALSRLDVGHCGSIKHRITTSDATPVYRRAYRIPFSKREEMQQQVEELIEKGIIEHSTSPWGSPALLVQKPDGSFRFVVDYRELNKVTRIDPYPLPNIQETISQLGAARFFTVMDMASGFWQIEMDENDKEKTAFNTPTGHYQWRRMPMGLVNSSAVWQRTADVILAGLVGKSCHVYLDDIIIYSETLEQHLIDVETVLVRFRSAGLKIKPSKCQFLKDQVKYLGHILSREGVRPDPEKLSCVRDYPAPRNAKEVRQFLGLIGYYRRHVAGFAEKAKPLTRLTSSKTAFSWSEEAQKAFVLLKSALTSAPLLRFPDFTKEFILMTDPRARPSERCCLRCLSVKSTRWLTQVAN